MAKNKKLMTETNSKSILLILSALLVAAFIFATFPAWESLIHAWDNSEDYSHGFFIVPIALYLIWTKKDRLAQIPVRGSLWGLVLVIFALLLFLFSHFAEIITLRSIAIIPLVSGMIVYLFGFAIMKELLFPVTLLFFMIPIPSQVYSWLTIPLQLIVSKVAVWLASIFGVPVYREGNVIHLPDRTLQVVRACSGMRSIISLLTLSAVLGYITIKANFLRFTLFLSGIPVAIMVNIIRVLLMLLAFHYFNLDLTTGHYHLFLGMAVFVLALAILLIIKRYLSIWDTSPA